MTAVFPLRYCFLFSVRWTGGIGKISPGDTFSKLDVRSRHTARMGDLEAKEHPGSGSGAGVLLVSGVTCSLRSVIKSILTGVHDSVVTSGLVVTAPRWDVVAVEDTVVATVC